MAVVFELFATGITDGLAGVEGVEIGDARGGGRVGLPGQPGVDLDGNLCRRSDALVKGLGHHGQADGLQLRVQALAENRRWVRCVVNHLCQDLGNSTFERQAARQQLVKHHAEAVDVAAGADLVQEALGLFGGHVGRRSKNCAGPGESGRVGATGLPGKAEVGQDGLSLRIDDHVGRLKIAMDDVPRVGMSQAIGEPGDDGGDLVDRQRVVGGDEVREGPPIDVGHGQETTPGRCRSLSVAR